MDNEFAIVKFIDNDFVLDVRADKNNDTVWLTQRQMAELFSVDTGIHKVITSSLAIPTDFKPFTYSRILSGNSPNVITLP